jgi:hypothetical protein
MWIGAKISVERKAMRQQTFAMVKEIWRSKKRGILWQVEFRQNRIPHYRREEWRNQ